MNLPNHVITARLNEALLEAKHRQLPGAKKDSGHMRGLREAIKVIDEIYTEAGNIGPSKNRRRIRRR